MKKQIDGFLVFPQYVGGKITDVKIGVSIIPSRVRGIFSHKLIERVRQSFGKKSEIFVDSKKGTAQISRVIPSCNVRDEVRQLKSDLKAVGIHAIETPLPREQDVNLVLAS